MKLAAAVLTALTLSAVAAQAETIRVGATAGPQAQILEVAKTVAARDGLTIKIVEFSDFVQPNAALADKALEANSYQHQPFLDAQVHDRGYKIRSIGQTVTLPMIIFSDKIKSLDEAPKGAKVSIPNDPTNGGRALLLLQDAGLIKVRPEAGLRATEIDITSNPRKLRIIPVEAAQVPRSIGDVSFAVVNANYAVSAGLDPKKALVTERPDSPYACVIAVRNGDENAEWAKKLVKAYQSPEVRDFIVKTFKGSLIPAF